MIRAGQFAENKGYELLRTLRMIGQTKLMGLVADWALNKDFGEPGILLVGSY